MSPGYIAAVGTSYTASSASATVAVVAARIAPIAHHIPGCRSYPTAQQRWSSLGLGARGRTRSSWRYGYKFTLMLMFLWRMMEEDLHSGTTSLILDDHPSYLFAHIILPVAYMIVLDFVLRGSYGL